MSDAPLDAEPANPATIRAAAAEVGAALCRCQRGAAFYDVDHPAARAQRRELETAIFNWHAAVGYTETLVAAAGDNLVLTGIEEGVGADISRNLCSMMISKSLLGVKLRPPIHRKELAELVSVLGEAEKRVRAAGGVGKILVEKGIRNIEAIEMDFDKLLSGAPVDHSALAPLVGKALTAILALKAQTTKRGAAIELTLEKVTSASSLGSLLDELIDGAAPGVAEEPPSPQALRTRTKTLAGSMVGATADDLAELCTKAYGKVAAPSKSPAALTEAANVLSAALVRLSPHARFKLLEKLASPVTTDEGAAAIGRAVPNGIVLSAIAQAVMGGSRDSQLASAIGNLLERMRPIERDRLQIIDELDETARRSGRPLEGLFLQELNELSQKKSFGGLDLPFRQTRASLMQVAKERQTTGGQPEIVTRTFASLRPENRFSRTARLLCGMLEHERVMAPATFTSVRGAIANSTTDPSLATAGGAIVFALWQRAVRDGASSAAASQLFEIAGSKFGPDWCIAVLVRLQGQRIGPDVSKLLGDFLRAVLAVHQTESFRRRLAENLDGLDRTVIRELERRVGELSPPGVATFIARAGRESPTAALSLAQIALRAPSTDVKEAALRALAPFPVEAVLQFLRKASGLDGDDKSLPIISAQKANPDIVFRLQRAAVDALGNSRSPEAVPILAELLTRVKLVGGTGFDKMRAPAARALAINNTGPARDVLDDGKRSRNRAERLASGGAT